MEQGEAPAGPSLGETFADGVEDTTHCYSVDAIAWPGCV